MEFRDNISEYKLSAEEVRRSIIEFIEKQHPEASKDRLPVLKWLDGGGVHVTLTPPSYDRK
jgi:hypothetical protein